MVCSCSWLSTWMRRWRRSGGNTRIKRWFQRAFLLSYRGSDGGAQAGGVGGGDECRYFEGTADERAGKRRSGRHWHIWITGWARRRRWIRMLCRFRLKMRRSLSGVRRRQGRKIPCAGRVCEPENEAYGAGDSGWKHCGVAVQKRPEKRRAIIARTTVCGFDLKTNGYQFRRFDKLSPEEIWGKMEEKDKETER